jgi:hypothetical protein
LEKQAVIWYGKNVAEQGEITALCSLTPPGSKIDAVHVYIASCTSDDGLRDQFLLPWAGRMMRLEGPPETAWNPGPEV